MHVAQQKAARRRLFNTYIIFWIMQPTTLPLLYDDNHLDEIMLMQ